MRISRRQIQARSLLIMAGIALTVTAGAFWSLYQVVLDKTQVQLQELARSQARLIEAVAKFDAVHTEPLRSSRADTLSQIRESHFRYRGFGETGEIVLVEKHGGMLHFLLPEPKLGFQVPPPLPLEGETAAPALRASAGASGVIRAPDFTGTEVLAAYEYLPFLEAGIIAKIDMAEIRSPFFQAALVTGLLALVALAVGMAMHARVVGPLVGEVFSVNEELAAREAKLATLSRQLSKYLSPQIYKSLFEGGTGTGIFTHRKKLTVFFSDIAGFTARTDAMEPEDLSYLLNSYLNAMAELVIKHGGTLDKFIGDAVLVFFGDPESRGVQEDALACVEMALEMQQTIDRLAREWQARGIGRALEVRMGITTGYCTVGNFGSDSRMEYTIIGNQVNLASRLESNALPGQILMSEETWTLVNAQFDCEAQPPLQVKGFSAPVQPYRLVGRVGERDAPAAVKVSGDGFTIQVDPAAMPGEERARAEAAMHQALEALKRGR